MNGSHLEWRVHTSVNWVSISVIHLGTSAHFLDAAKGVIKIPRSSAVFTKQRRRYVFVREVQLIFDFSKTVNAREKDEPSSGETS